MRILHVLSQKPDLTGSGIYVQAMIRESAARGHQNYLIAAANSSCAPPNLENSEISLINFETELLDYTLPGMSDVMPYRSSRFSDLQPKQIEVYEHVFLQKIIHAIDTFKPDIIHSHHLWLLSSLIGQNIASPAITTSCHGSDIRQFYLCPHLQLKILDGCRKIDHILALTQSQKNEISDTYNISLEKISVVGAGFDNSTFTFAEKRKQSHLQLLYCGKLSRAKGVPHLLKALQPLQEFDWHLHLVGSGTDPERSECLELAEQLGNRITVYGALKQSQLAAILQKTHFFILPSLFEGLPLVILEALACGCRIIASDLPGCREIKEKVDTDLMYLINLPRLNNIDAVEAADERHFINTITHALVQAFSDIHNSPLLTQERVERNVSPFTWKRVYGKISDIYIDLT